jgi:PKD repeat protein
MKYFILFALLLPFQILGQTPNSILENIQLQNEVILLEAPENIQDLALAETLSGESFKFAKFVSSDITINNSGNWTNAQNGKIWSVDISSQDAKNLSLYFNQFWIPSGGKLFIYNKEKTQFAGPYTSKNNHSSGLYASELIIGDHIILEYFQPSNQSELPLISIDKVAYGYKKVGGTLGGYGSSDDCQVNANCSEGDNWENQKTSVCRIQIPDGQFVGLCSGALINNTSGNCQPLVLSADHCFSGGNISNNDLNQTIYYFNYESSGCNNSVPNYEAITGCQLLANSGNEGDVGDSDFFLVELNSEPTFDPYFSGWDRSNTGATSGVSIHHPSGDIKKISTFSQTLVSASGLGFGNDNTTHWRVYWDATSNGHGVTEGGSSGSPIYNQNGLIVGDLTGGSSYCTATNQADIYGKLWHGWDQMGNTNSTRLKPWLDPGNSGVTILNGSYCNPNSVSAGFNSNQTVLCINESVTFSSNSSGNISNYSWQFYGGSPATANGPGPHNVTYPSSGTFDVILTVTGPEGNDTYSQSNYISVGQNQVELDFLPDCYGIETAWTLQSTNGQVIEQVDFGYYPGGETADDMEPNPSILTENWCLVDGCYNFTVFDEYGDGLYGSQYSCEFDGDYTIYDNNGNVLAELTAQNSDFGEQITSNFCVTSDAPDASWRCVNNQCVDPQDGSGEYSSYNACIAQCNPTSSIDDQKLRLLNIYPNPFNDMVVVESELVGTIKIYNTLSQLLFTQSKNSTHVELDLSRLQSGIYFVELKNQLFKIVKE